MKLADNIFWILPTLLVPVVVGAVFLLDRKYDAEAPNLTTDPGAYELAAQAANQVDLRPGTNPAAGEDRAKPSSPPSSSAPSTPGASQEETPVSPPPAAGVGRNRADGADTPSAPAASPESTPDTARAGSPSGQAASGETGNNPGTPNPPAAAVDKSAATAPNGPTDPTAGNPDSTDTTKSPPAPAGAPANSAAPAPTNSPPAATPPDRNSAPQPAPKPAPKEPSEPKPAPKPAPTEHVVKSGDNPWTIAQRYGVNMNDILSLNNIKDARNIQIGQVLKLPPRKPGDPAPAAATTKAKAAPSAKPPAPGSGYELYTIKKGENPWTISKKLKVSHQSILDLNKNLNFRDLKIGQQIKVPKK